MPIYRLQTSLQDDSGLPRDQFVNSIHVDSGTGSQADQEAWSGALGLFYGGFQSYLSPVIRLTGHTVKTYLVGAPLESPPTHTYTFDLTAIGSTSLPNEVACCLSMRGALHPGWNRQSTRGRIYIGPLAVSASENVTGGGAVPATPFRLELTARFKTLCTNIAAVNGAVGIYSKLHGAITPVIECSVDNEWDTQRSRGHRATAKTVLAIP